MLLSFKCLKRDVTAGPSQPTRRQNVGQLTVAFVCYENYESRAWTLDHSVECWPA